MKVAVIGAGWAGCAAAVEATRRGHSVTIFEAARTAGGRARRVDATQRGEPGSELPALDNGQHILIGAYTETLALMRDLGLDAARLLKRLPMTLRYPDGVGLQFAALPAPLDALVGIASARGWSLADKYALLRAAAGWRLANFECAASQTVSTLCARLTPTVMRTLIEPLCVSALNTPADRASGAVFLRVLRDALFAGNGSADFLLPRVDLSALLPDAALRWSQVQGGQSHIGVRVQTLTRRGAQWAIQAGAGSDAVEVFDTVILACPPQEAARLVESSGQDASDQANRWSETARALQHEAITTVYAQAPLRTAHTLTAPLLALHADAANPAQFVFDRGQLGGPAGLLAFVISVSTGDAANLGEQVLAQAARQLGLQLSLVKTIVEKRATFSCTPSLERPGMHPNPAWPTLLACGDYVAGPYPATLEGAVRSGLAAARSC